MLGVLRQCDSRVAVECLIVLTEVCRLFDPVLVGKYGRGMLKSVNGLRDHKKRVVRRMARTLINQLSMEIQG